MLHKITFELITKVVLWVIFWALLATLSTPLMAETNEQTRTSKSISFTENEALKQIEKDQKLKAASADVIATINNEGFRTESTLTALKTVSSDYIDHADTFIYDVSTDLISDFNNDGFYHRFSVTIDADTIYETAYIYTQVYLSYEGGPWHHYATSENYPIYGDSGDDTFVIETELAEGYLAGYYDIRIELYDADHDHWLQSYGPYDNASLNALPLEGSIFDEQYEIITPAIETEVVISSHGGMMSGWFLALFGAIRYIRKTNSNTK